MHHTLDRLRTEFLEMPGLRLTADQVHRLCGVERAACAWALDTLVEEHFLSVRPDGTYVRATDVVAGRRLAKASLPRKRQIPA
jgi:hypothetical protein